MNRLPTDPTALRSGQVVRGRESRSRARLLIRSRRGAEDGWEVTRLPNGQADWISDWQMCYFDPEPQPERTP